MARRPTAQKVPASARPSLPDDLAPTLREAVDNLLRQVPLARGRGERPVRRGTRHGTVVNRCVFCHKGGKLGGHHDETGEVVWVHRKCHRRHHRSPRRTARSERWWQARAVPVQLFG